jgi:hypothetical protein
MHNQLSCVCLLPEPSTFLALSTFNTYCSSAVCKLFGQTSFLGSGNYWVHVRILEIRYLILDPTFGLRIFSQNGKSNFCKISWYLGSLPYYRSIKSQSYGSVSYGTVQLDAVSYNYSEVVLLCNFPSLLLCPLFGP